MLYAEASDPKGQNQTAKQRQYECQKIYQIFSFYLFAFMLDLIAYPNRAIPILRKTPHNTAIDKTKLGT
jgi:hypothetical protein